MSLSSININYFINILSQHDDVSVESIDNFFNNLKEIVQKSILKQEYELVFDLFIDLLKRESELKHIYPNAFQFNNIDFNKLFVYEIHSFHVQIIDTIVIEITNAYHDFLLIRLFSPTFANKIKDSTFTKVNSFVKVLTENRFLNTSIIDQCINEINHSLQKFKN